MDNIMTIAMTIAILIIFIFILSRINFIINKYHYTSSQIEEIQREFSTNKYNSKQIENIVLLANKKVPFELINLVLDPNIDSFMIFEIYYNYDDLQLIGVKEILSQLEKGIYDSGYEFENKAKIFIANKKLEDLKNSISKNIN